MDLYFNLGYNLKEFYQYYLQCRLEEKLSDYSQAELEMVKEYLKEKESTLTLKKNL